MAAATTAKQPVAAGTGAPKASRQTAGAGRPSGLLQSCPPTVKRARSPLSRSTTNLHSDEGSALQLQADAAILRAFPLKRRRRIAYSHAADAVPGYAAAGRGLT